jgi:16S rRNA (guanine527-N7)-methyltransferase
VIEDVLGALAEAKALGFLGPGPLETHVASGEAFAEALGHLPAGSRAVDLGSGGGVPGLLLAERFPESSWVLLDSSRRRTSFLVRAAAELGWGSRVEVVRAAAEEAGRDPQFRGRFDVVTARSFGPTAITVECAAGLLVSGGRLLVSEPPEPDPVRWPKDGLAAAGLRWLELAGSSPAIAILESPAGPPEALPRTRRTMDRTPLWR